jgi:hypothetical protein
MFLFLGAVVTTSIVPRWIPIDDIVPNTLPSTEYDKQSWFTRDTPPVILTPSLSVHSHSEKPREVVYLPYTSFSRSDRCSKNTCKQYLKSLNLNIKYFNFKYNKCYCSECYVADKPDFYIVANSIYTVPRGWTRFGLQIDEIFVESRNLFRTWCTTFYGTSNNKLESILRNRFIPFPGDIL